jgi:hypothetical protein
MPEKMCAVLITISLIVALVAWVPVLHLVERRMKRTRILRSAVNPHLRKQSLPPNAKTIR